MCGIAGIISNNSSIIAADRVKKMTDALAHRGPDAEGHWVNSTTALGNRRLAIIDLSSAANQPMHYLQRYTIIHNGEIYNYIELKEELQKKGYSFNSRSDTEVIVAAYDHWKEECVDHFDGMFAFAVWDEKEKELFAARDRFGEKPFFYFLDNDQFVFASEMKALWAAGIERKVNLKLLFNYLTIGYVDNPNIPEETFFENISKLPAASFLKFSTSNFQLSISNYWDLDVENENKKISDTEAIEKFGFLFQRSVQRRLRSDVAIGTSLSGGLDSSSVVATAAPFTPALRSLGEGGIHDLPTGQAGSPFTSFTAHFPGFEKDESLFSKQVAEQFGLQQFITNISADEMLNDWDKICYHQEEPFQSASVVAQYSVFELASQQQVKVLRDGQGAD